ncbi:FMN-binding negative transcriptional regulator [uncultured Agrococcus sp.]|uniref:FMN-binding negative transcriptional regulator n=1 Tax=uncultured Agrococcus sp. TaxID=382258 RepID=UPI0025F8C7D4|nr:FMN-binding negative transcriptional regulator [uncultured Agrococcus sp.]
MHTYPNYHPPDGRALVDLVRTTPFALAVTSQSGAPIATHVPVVVPPGVDLRERDSLVGVTLWSHMGRRNRHWQLMQESPEVLLIHSSSHGYVSPTLYRKEGSVPTVDYAAVHLTGTVRLMLEDEDALAVVEQTVAQLEGTRAEQWDMTPSKGVFRNIIGGVTAFAITIMEEQAVFKLSQEQPKDIRTRVRDEFAGDVKSSIPGCPHADLAQLMDALPEDHVKRGHFPPEVAS